MPSFQADTFFIEDPNDSTKRLKFDVSGLPASTTRIIKPPSGDGTLAALELANNWSQQQAFSRGIFSSPIDGSNPAIKVAQFVNQTNRLIHAVDGNGVTVLALEPDGRIQKDSSTGWSGTYQTGAGQTVTVVDGIVVQVA